ncbi:MAG: type secretion system minor pseudopilin GspK [Deltaproteobacteria bacterium]|nr:type secretion system minor pseudopilin GspK [Deltaproteobacteria bacterium]
MRRPRESERGVALLTTLLVLVLVVALANEIFRLGARAAQTSAYGRDSVRAGLLAEAGTGALRIALREDAKANKYDTLDEYWSRPAPPFDLGDGTVTIIVEDEDRKINLNKLVGTHGNAPDDMWLAVFRAFLEQRGIDASLADAFVDWLDNDDSPRVGGAESSYYMSLPRPYMAKNDLFDTLEEILLVRGVTREIYEKIRPFVTVTSSGKININTAPMEVLTALSAGKIAAEFGAIDNAAANRLIEYRKEQPFQKVSEIGNVSPFFKNLQSKTLFGTDVVDVKSSYFHVRSTGDVGGTVRTVDAIGFRTGNNVVWYFWRLE